MPWPATTSGSSNGCTKAMPDSSACALARDEALVDVVAPGEDLGTERLGALDLGDRRGSGHEDLAGHAARAGGEGQGLGVVAGARRHHAPRAALLPQRRELAQRAADLERAGALQVLGLQDDLAAAVVGQRRARQDRRVARDGRRSRRGRARPPRPSALRSSAGQRDDGVDLDVGALGQRGDRDGHPGRRLVVEELRVDLVDRARSRPCPSARRSRGSRRPAAPRRPRRPPRGSSGTGGPARPACRPRARPLAGSSATCPEQNSRPLLLTAWL